MAKATVYKLEWVGSPVGQQWDIPDGWEVVQLVLPIQEQKGKILVLLRGTEK